MFGNIGSGEIIFILFVAFLLFGAKRLPEIGRGLGKGIAEFKNTLRGVQDEVTRTIEEEPPKPPKS
ncbi:MAG: twin-arginine translocase TatA/TatE family subunit [Candidatus Latescibacteria bacterium]|nr:twin-arginine translocase TatA/TatE family subunit [Candidatus Latescibacterota bacterium]